MGNSSFTNLSILVDVTIFIFIERLTIKIDNEISQANNY